MKRSVANARDVKPDVDKTDGLMYATEFPIVLSKHLSEYTIDDIDNGRKIVRTMKYDRNNYSQFTDIGWDVYDSLSKRGRILIKYIVRDVVKFGTPYFRLDIDDVANLFKEKNVTNCYKIVRELINSGFIKRGKNVKDKHNYTINHNYIFRGSYDNFIDTYKTRVLGIHDNNTDKLDNTESIKDFLDRYKIEILVIESEDGKGLENFEV